MLNCESKIRIPTFLAMVSLLTVLAMPGAHASSRTSAMNFGLSLRAGTLGAGLDLDAALNRSFTVRIGYSGFTLNHSLNTTDVNYHGSLKLSTVTALLDWYPFKGGFHLTAGVAGENTRLDVTGEPVAGTFTINGQTYTSSQLVALTGRAKFSQSAAPYIGLGWGNPVGTNSRLHFLFDIGAIYTGHPVVTLNAQCGSLAPAGSPLCSEIQTNAANEQRVLYNKINKFQWYPVVDLGVAVRF